MNSYGNDWHFRYENFAQNNFWKFEAIDITETNLRGYKVGFLKVSVYLDFNKINNYKYKTFIMCTEALWSSRFQFVQVLFCVAFGQKILPGLHIMSSMAGRVVFILSPSWSWIENFRLPCACIVWTTTLWIKGSHHYQALLTHTAYTWSIY